MDSELKIILAILITGVICAAAFFGYLYHEEQVRKEKEKQAQLEELERQLNETQKNLDEINESASSSSTKSSSSSSSSTSSSGGKVTYEEAGVDKNVGYMKTCKYPGCGAVYNSRLAYCPKCGQRNIYV